MTSTQEQIGKTIPSLERLSEKLRKFIILNEKLKSNKLVFLDLKGEIIETLDLETRQELTMISLYRRLDLERDIEEAKHLVASLDKLLSINSKFDASITQGLDE